MRERVRSSASCVCCCYCDMTRGCVTAQRTASCLGPGVVLLTVLMCTSHSFGGGALVAGGSLQLLDLALRENSCSCRNAWGSSCGSHGGAVAVAQQGAVTMLRCQMHNNAALCSAEVGCTDGSGGAGVCDLRLLLVSGLSDTCLVCVSVCAQCMGSQERPHSRPAASRTTALSAEQAAAWRRRAGGWSCARRRSSTTRRRQVELSVWRARL